MIGSISIDCAEHPGIIGSNDQLPFADNSIAASNLRAWLDALNVGRNLAPKYCFVSPCKNSSF